MRPCRCRWSRAWCAGARELHKYLVSPARRRAADRGGRRRHGDGEPLRSRGFGVAQHGCCISRVGTVDQRGARLRRRSSRGADTRRAKQGTSARRGRRGTMPRTRPRGEAAPGRVVARSRWPGTPCRLQDETKHFKLIGTTGTGKSTAIQEILTARSLAATAPSSRIPTAAICSDSTIRAAATSCSIPSTSVR